MLNDNDMATGLRHGLIAGRQRKRAEGREEGEGGGGGGRRRTECVKMIGGKDD